MFSLIEVLSKCLTPTAVRVLGVKIVCRLPLQATGLLRQTLFLQPQPVRVVVARRDVR